MQVRPITRRSDYRSSARETSTASRGCPGHTATPGATVAVGASGAGARSRGAAATLLTASAAVAAALALLALASSARALDHSVVTAGPIQRNDTAGGRMRGCGTTLHGVDKVPFALCVHGGTDSGANDLVSNGDETVAHGQELQAGPLVLR